MDDNWGCSDRRARPIVLNRTVKLATEQTCRRTLVLRIRRTVADTWATSWNQMIVAVELVNRRRPLVTVDLNSACCTTCQTVAVGRLSPIAHSGQTLNRHHSDMVLARTDTNHQECDPPIVECSDLTRTQLRPPLQQRHRQTIDSTGAAGREFHRSRFDCARIVFARADQRRAYRRPLRQFESEVQSAVVDAVVVAVDQRPRPPR